MTAAVVVIAGNRIVSPKRSKRQGHQFSRKSSIVLTDNMIDRAIKAYESIGLHNLWYPQTLYTILSYFQYDGTNVPAHLDGCLKSKRWQRTQVGSIHCEDRKELSDIT